MSSIQDMDWTLGGLTPNLIKKAPTVCAPGVAKRLLYQKGWQVRYSKYIEIGKTLNMKFSIAGRAHLA